MMRVEEEKGTGVMMEGETGVTMEGGKETDTIGDIDYLFVIFLHC